MSFTNEIYANYNRSFQSHDSEEIHERFPEIK